MPHAGNKTYQCSHCGKIFPFKSYLNRHEATHTEDKPYQCDHCEKTFAAEGDRNTHMRKHTGKQPYSCNQCDKTFSWRSSRDIHQRTHTGEKPFNCIHCHKSFSEKNTLKRHLSIHTGDKPFKCLHCGKGFPDNGMLNRHIKIHTREITYQNRHHDKIFLDENKVDSHMTLHTEEPLTKEPLTVALTEDEGLQNCGASSDEEIMGMPQEESNQTQENFEDEDLEQQPQTRYSYKEFSEALQVVEGFLQSQNDKEAVEMHGYALKMQSWAIRHSPKNSLTPLDNYSGHFPQPKNQDVSQKNIPASLWPPIGYPVTQQMLWPSAATNSGGFQP